MSVQTLVVKEVNHMPETLEEGILYVSRPFELATHLCACGCKGEAVTPFDKEVSRTWVLSEGPSGGPSLYPSIGHQHWPCGSHYFVTDGKIVLCSDHGLNKKKP